MRMLLAFSALALVGLAAPAAAQGCGSETQGQAATTLAPARPAMSMMCSGTTGQTAAPTQPDQSQTGMMMCPCCRGMAMMRPQGSG